MTSGDFREDEWIAQIRTFDPLPSGVVARDLSPAELLEFGLPSRPADNSPRLRALWDRLTGADYTYARADPQVQTGPSGTRHTPAADHIQASPWWAGAYQLAPIVSGPTPVAQFRAELDAVAAEWVVPNAFPPAASFGGGPPEPGEYFATSFIGLDGAPGTNRQVVQCGTDDYLTVTGGLLNGHVDGPQPEAWFQWHVDGVYSPSASLSRSIPIRAGDLVACVVAVTDLGTSALIMFANETYKLTTSVLLAAPRGVGHQGLSAEWIVERPFGLEQNDGTIGFYPYPNFGAVPFLNALAIPFRVEPTREALPEIDLTGATLVGVKDGHQVLATPKQMSDVDLVVRYTGP